MGENEENKCLHLEEMTDQQEGLNYVIAHTLLHISCSNLICSLSCAMQLLFLSLSFSCGPGHFWPAFAMSDGLRAVPFSPRKAMQVPITAAVSQPWEMLFSVVYFLC